MEGEINPQLYDNEVLPPLCQYPSRSAANLSGVDHLGSNAGTQRAESPPSASALPRVFSCGVNSLCWALFFFPWGGEEVGGRG